MNLVCGVQELGLPDLFAGARRRIILHAAVYGPFSKSEDHLQGLRKALSRPGFTRLDVIAVQSGMGNGWTDPFIEALRFGVSSKFVKEELDLSDKFLMDLAEAYPGKVNIYPACSLPCLPVVIVDDIICFGQYAHSSFHAPHGFWGCVEADVEKLFDWAESGSMPQGLSPAEVAAFRLVSECSRAMTYSSGDEGVNDGCSRS